MMYTALFMVLAGATVDHVVVAASDRGELGLLTMIPNARSAGRGLLQDQASSLRFDVCHAVPQASSVCGCVRHQTAHHLFGQRSPFILQIANPTAIGQLSACFNTFMFLK